MSEYIERESTYDDFEKCNAENPKWTPGRVKTLIARQPAADVVSTDLISEKMYDFYQKAVSRADVNADYLDGVYDLMDYIARWFEQEE